MLDFLNNPEMPKALPALMAIAILFWVVFLVYFAYTSREVGPSAAVNRIVTFLITLALGFTIVTSCVWNWGVRQASSRISTSAGWELLDSASGGVTKLGQAAEANRVSILDTAPEFAGAATTINPQSGGGQQQVVVDPTPQPAVQTVPQPADYEFGQKTLKGVGEIHAWRAKVEGDLWIYNQLVLIDGSVVSAPSELPSKIPTPPPAVPVQQLVVIQPQPTPVLEQVAPPAALSEEELLKEQVACFLLFATANSLSAYTGKDGTAILPYGIQFQLTGPGGVLDFGSWIWTSAEIWQLSIPAVKIEMPVTGTWARSIPGANDSGTVMISGRGMFCQPQP